MWKNPFDEGTEEWVTTELAHCTNDYGYTLKKYGKIIHPIDGEIPFGLFDYQEKVLDIATLEDRMLILKGRQLGLSTVYAGFIACEMIFNKNYKAAIVSDIGLHAQNFIAYIKTFLKNFPD
jgi:hypothetical protein